MTRRLPSVFVVGAVLALAGVVAGTSHTSAWAPPREGVMDVSELLTIVVLAFSASFAIAGGGLYWLRRSGEASWHRVLHGAVVLAALASLIGISNTALRLEADAPAVERIAPDSSRIGIRLESEWRGPAVRGADEESSTEALPPASASRSRFARLLLVFVGMLGLALLIRARRPSQRPDPVQRSESGEAYIRVAAHGAIMMTIDAMLADPDPRTAIIGAYARLLEELEAIGASRKAYEGPTEHLHRVLQVLEVRPRPLETLIRLFEVARFSEHSLTAIHRDQALAALRKAAAGLAGPVGSPLPTGVAG